MQLGRSRLFLAAEKRKVFHIPQASLAAIVTLLCSSASFAADSPSSEPTTGLDEIIVTAQRKETNLERTPVAISVLSGEAFAQQNITTEVDLRTEVPGLGVRSTTNSNQLNYVIRGQSLDAFSDNRPGVLPYFNEVQVGGSGTASAFYDLQSVQVLKGPQGTLFGRNATGGAVVFTTQMPTNEFGGYIAARAGNYNSQQYDGAINLPIVADKVLFRIAGFYQRRNGYQYDTFEQHRIGRLERYGARPSLTVNFTDSLKNTLVVDVGHYKGAGTTPVLNQLDPTGAIPVTFLNQGPGLDAVFGPGAWASVAAANPRLDPNSGIAQFLQTQQARGPFRVTDDAPNGGVSDNTIVSNITTLDLSSQLQFKNIVGYTRLNQDTEYDADGSPFYIDYNQTFFISHQISDEAQLLGKAFDNRLNYVAGVYFANETARYVNPATFIGLEPLISPTLQLTTYRRRNKTYAGYTQGTYDLSSMTGINGLSVTAGVRYQSEKASSEVLPEDATYARVLANPATESVFQSKTFNNIGWTFSVQDQLTDSTMIYLASRHASRNGGFNGGIEAIRGSGNEGGNGFLTEKDTDVEAGVKFQGTLADMPVRANLAVYNTWIENAQHVAYTLTPAGAASTASVNVPRALVSGVEVDGQINPTEWLKLGLSYTYTDARFTNNRVSVLGRLPVVYDTYPDAPKSSGTAFAEVSIPVSASKTVSLHGDIYSQSRMAYLSNANANAGAFLGGYSVADFRLALDDKSGWSVSGNVKNAFNRVYYAGGLAVAQIFQFNSVIPGDPRTYSVEARYTF